MTKEQNLTIQTVTACAMLVVGSALSVWGFVVPPAGEISDSVLWFFAQCLIYAGSVFGVKTYIDGKFTDIRHDLHNKING